MLPQSRFITRFLSQAGPGSFSIYCIAAAFSTYFCMYAFRKPFTAGEFLGVTVGQLPFKPILVATQVLGYTCAKFIGIKFVSEVPGPRRASSILAMILLAEFTLLLFAITPPPYNAVWLFFNGLSLGMVFGLVVVFLEGRRLSEALVAGLCASFIVSSGYVKSAGRYVLAWDVSENWRPLLEQVGAITTSQRISEYWMPFITGLAFVIPLLIAVWLLNHLPGPDAEDVVLRTQRSSMDRFARKSFYQRHAFGLSGLLLMFIALTVVRGLRDDFAVEIWKQLGFTDQPSIFARSETWVMFGVVGINGATIFIKNNRLALLSSIGVMMVGFALTLASVVGLNQGILPPFPYMVLIGLGLYLPYIAFHTTVFERLIASFREVATLGYLMCLADAVGYLAYVGIVFWDNFGKAQLDYLGLLNRTSVIISVASLVLCVVLLAHYSRKLSAVDSSS